MKLSVFNHLLPESFADAQQLRATKQMRFSICRECKTSLSSTHAAYSTAGWRETQVSGICEPCFDSLTQEPRR